MSRSKSKSPKEIFFSHASKDERFASKLAKVLRGHGLRVWYSPTIIIGAQQWHDEIGAALDRCDWFAVVLSPHAVKSGWVKRELLYALQTPRYTNRIIPISYKECKHRKLSWTLPSHQFVDFTGKFDVGCQELMKVWGKRYKS